MSLEVVMSTVNSDCNWVDTGECSCENPSECNCECGCESCIIEYVLEPEEVSYGNSL